MGVVVLAGDSFQDRKGDRDLKLHYRLHMWPVMSLLMDKFKSILRSFFPQTQPRLGLEKAPDWPHNP